jgi:hypothetical protein
MLALILAVLFIALLVFATRRAAACPLFRTLAISANCWAEGAGRQKDAARSKAAGLLR